jgi:hypothetical protein
MSYGYYGPMETWKIVYFPKVMNGGMRGVAFVEAGDRGHAMQTFREQYSGQYSTIDSCEKLFE